MAIFAISKNEFVLMSVRRKFIVKDDKIIGNAIVVIINNAKV